MFCFAICALLASSFWLLLDLRDGDLRQARAQLHGLGKIMGTQTRNALDGVSLSLRSAQECRRAFKFDHLCSLNFDQV